MATITSLPKLKTLNLDNNPCSRNIEFSYELILRLPKLRSLNEDAVNELDRDVAQMHFEMKGVTIGMPEPKPVLKTEKAVQDKKVSFKVPAGDQEDWQEVELEKTRARMSDL